MTHPARKLLAKKRPKPIRCKAPGCPKTFTRERDGQDVCGYQCALVLHNHRKAGAMERQRLKAAREVRERKQAVKTPTQLWQAELKRAERAVCRYARIRDSEDSCISCGRSVAEVEAGPDNGGGYWDGGHFVGKGAHPAVSLRLSTWNIHKQCKSCNGGENRYRHGGKRESVREGYERRLTEKIGAQRVAWLKGPHPYKHRPVIEYLERVKQVFNKRCRHLKKLRGYQ